MCETCLQWKRKKGSFGNKGSEYQHLQILQDINKGDIKFGKYWIPYTLPFLSIIMYNNTVKTKR